MAVRDGMAAVGAKVYVDLVIALEEQLLSKLQREA